MPLRLQTIELPFRQVAESNSTHSDSGLLILAFSVILLLNNTQIRCEEGSKAQIPSYLFLNAGVLSYVLKTIYFVMKVLFLESSGIWCRITLLNFRTLHLVHQLWKKNYTKEYSTC